ncbi:hypothetical protein ITP53_07045 [Nonomuraea sp. K274]|uniref:Uncharacterized protein n=1 Tax=Nonomuraea cypriaca TaxID=1187855 RepID=A0A931A8U2_9ACTN|nr:hypothetical protein [Nonomuraea cypriaca]
MNARHPARFLTLWSINAPLAEEELFAQLQVFAAHGLDGVVFHPRHHPGPPACLSGPYFDVVSRVILRAKELPSARSYGPTSPSPPTCCSSSPTRYGLYRSTTSPPAGRRGRRSHAGRGMRRSCAGQKKRSRGSGSVQVCTRRW